MSKKRIPFLTVLSLCIALLNPAKIYCAEQTAEQFVFDFYLWYMTEMANSSSSPEKNDKIYEYVYKCTVEKCRIDLKKGIVFSDYFIKTNGFDPSMIQDIHTYPAIKLNDTVNLVPIGGTEPYAIVFVQKFGKDMRITKVESFYPAPD